MIAPCISGYQDLGSKKCPNEFFFGSNFSNFCLCALTSLSKNIENCPATVSQVVGESILISIKCASNAFNIFCSSSFVTDNVYTGLKTADLLNSTEPNGLLSKSFKSILITNRCAASLNLLICVKFTVSVVLTFLILLSAANPISILLFGRKLTLLNKSIPFSFSPVWFTAYTSGFTINLSRLFIRSLRSVYI